jgi:hypothetical protein
MQADQIRVFVSEQYFAPAQASGQVEVVLRAGDVHRQLGLSNSMPAVCSVLGGSKLQASARVRLIDRTGPKYGANVYFRFGLNSASVPARGSPEKSSSLDSDGFSLSPDSDLALVACVKRKQAVASPARILYTSPWFELTRNLVERSGARWFILSAQYGLLDPARMVEPYEKTLNRMNMDERHQWANGVLGSLLPQLGSTKRVVLFAGQAYREFLVAPLEKHGLAIDVPMKGLSLGKQLSWLSSKQ